MAAMVNENFQNVGKLQTVDTRPFSGQAWGQGYMLMRRANHRQVLCVPVVL